MWSEGISYQKAKFFVQLRGALKPVKIARCNARDAVWGGARPCDGPARGVGGAGAALRDATKRRGVYQDMMSG